MPGGEVVVGTACVRAGHRRPLRLGLPAGPDVLSGEHLLACLRYAIVGNA